MSRKMLHNRVQLMNSINRKKMYKKGKSWIVAGALFLALLGGTAVATHADANVNPQSNSNQPSVVNTNPNDIQAKSQALHSALVNQQTMTKTGNSNPEQNNNLKSVSSSNQAPTYDYTKPDMGGNFNGFRIQYIDQKTGRIVGSYHYSDPNQNDSELTKANDILSNLRKVSSDSNQPNAVASVYSDSITPNLPVNSSYTSDDLYNASSSRPTLLDEQVNYLYPSIATTSESDGTNNLNNIGFGYSDGVYSSSPDYDYEDYKSSNLSLLGNVLINYSANKNSKYYNDLNLVQNSNNVKSLAKELTSGLTFKIPINFGGIKVALIDGSDEYSKPLSTYIISVPYGAAITPIENIYNDFESHNNDNTTDLLPDVENNLKIDSVSSSNVNNLKGYELTDPNDRTIFENYIKNYINTEGMTSGFAIPYTTAGINYFPIYLNKKPQNKIDTVQFKHGNQLIKSEQKQGRKNTTFNVSNDVPSQYNVNSGTQFTFDGQTHVVQLGIDRPDDNQTTPIQNDVVDTIDFIYNDQIITSKTKQGPVNTSFKINNDEVPSSYYINSNPRFRYDGKTHDIELTKAQEPQSQFAKVIINYMNGMNGQFINSMSDFNYVNTPFNLSQYETLAPVSFLFDGTVKNPITEYGPDPVQNVYIYVKPLPVYNIVDKNTNKKVGKPFHLRQIEYKQDYLLLTLLNHNELNRVIPSGYKVCPSSENPLLTDNSKPQLGQTYTLYVYNPNEQNKTDNILFKYGNKLIKQEQKQGQNNTPFSIAKDVPKQYNWHSRATFNYDGQTHVVQLGIIRPNGNQIIKPKQIPTYPNGNQTVAMKTDKLIFVHGESKNSPLVKQLQLSGQNGTSIDVSNLIPSQYNINDGTQVPFDGDTHYIYLGINRPNNNQIVKPKENNVRPNGNKELPIQMDTIDTVQFMHGKQLVKSEQKEGQESTTFDVKNDIPSQYNVNSGTQFKFDGQTHVVQLGISRPNGNQIVKPRENNVRPNGNQELPVQMDTVDTIQFKHGNQLVKSEQKQGQMNSSFDVKNDVPNQYNVNSGTQFTFNGGTHIVQLGVNRPNGLDNNITPTLIKPNKPASHHNSDHKPVRPNKPSDHNSVKPNNNTPKPNNPANHKNNGKPVKPSANIPNNGNHNLPNNSFNYHNYNNPVKPINVIPNNGNHNQPSQPTKVTPNNAQNHRPVINNNVPNNAQGRSEPAQHMMKSQQGKLNHRTNKPVVMKPRKGGHFKTTPANHNYHVIRKSSIYRPNVKNVNHYNQKKLPQTSEPIVHTSMAAAILAGVSALVAGLGKVTDRRKRN